MKINVSFYLDTNNTVIFTHSKIHIFLKDKGMLFAKNKFELKKVSVPPASVIS
jgi:hypothetical protein